MTRTEGLLSLCILFFFSCAEYTAILHVVERGPNCQMQGGLLMTKETRHAQHRGSNWAWSKRSIIFQDLLVSEWPTRVGNAIT